MAYFNEIKEKRARAVVENPNAFDVESVERKAHGMATGEKLVGEALVARIYGIMGGKVGTENEVEISKKGTKKK